MTAGASPSREDAPKTRASVRATGKTRALPRRRAAFLECAWTSRFAKNLASHDIVIGVYFVIVLLAIAFGLGPGRAHSFEVVVTDLVLYATGLVLTRGGVIKTNTPASAFFNALLYRLTLFSALFLSYFQLRFILPAVSERAVDAQIYGFDLKVFGFEPSVAWDRFVTPQTTEWFAFFYFGYFFILAIHVFPFMLAAKNERLISDFALGIFVVFCSAHSIYMAVPGYGPYHFLAGDFHHELTGGTFWHLVREAVDAGGAQKDIFPSLHTAAPTFFALFSYRHRDKLPFKYTWPVLAFCVVNIILATMFLRWHYLVDICAGLTLATIANLLGAYVTPWEIARRKRLGVDPIFVPIPYPSPRRLVGAPEGAEQPAE